MEYGEVKIIIGCMVYFFLFGVLKLKIGIYFTIENLSFTISFGIYCFNIYDVKIFLALN